MEICISSLAQDSRILKALMEMKAQMGQGGDDTKDPEEAEEPAVQPTASAEEHPHKKKRKTGEKSSENKEAKETGEMKNEKE